MSTELPNLDEPISYAVDNGAQAGPFTMRDIIDSVRSGERAQDTYVWWAGEAEWVPFNTVDALMTLANPSEQSVAPEPEEPVAPEPEELVEEATDGSDSLGAQMFGGHGATTEIREAADEVAESSDEPLAAEEPADEQPAAESVDEPLAAESFEEPFEPVVNPFAEIDNGELENVDWSRDEPETEAESESVDEQAVEPDAEVEETSEPGDEAGDGDDQSPLEAVNDRIEALGAAAAVGMVDDEIAEDGDTASEPEPEPEPEPEGEADDAWSALHARSDELATQNTFANHRVAAVADAVVGALSDRGFDVASETAVGLTHRLHASPADDGGDDVSATVAGLVTSSGSAGDHVEVSMHRQDASVNLILETAEYVDNNEAVASAVHSMLSELGRRVG